MSRQRFEFALERLEPSHWEEFEKLASTFLATEFPNLRVKASPSGDKGRDATLWGDDGDEDVVLQYSVAEDWTSKIRRTIAKVLEEFPETSELIYVTHWQIGALGDSLQRETKLKHGINLDIRDGSWFLNRWDWNESRRLATYDLSERIVDPILKDRGLKDVQDIDLTSEETRAKLGLLSARILAKLQEEAWLNAGPLAVELQDRWTALIGQVPMWHETVSQLLDGLSHSLSAAATLDAAPPEIRTAAARCQGVDTSGEYPAVRSDTAHVIREIPNLLRDWGAAAEPDEAADAPDARAAIRAAWTPLDLLLRESFYARCLCVAASSREGKTHFVADQLVQPLGNDAGQLTLMVRLSPGDPTPMPEVLASAAAEATDQPWDDWLTLATSAHRDGLHVVVAVEGIDRWASTQIDALFAEIDRSTRVPSIYWIVTADLNGLDALTAYRDRWIRYGPGARRFRRNTTADLAAAPTIDGWFALDATNDREATGAQIIARLLAAQTGHDSTFPAASELPAARLATPFTAWVLHQVASDASTAEQLIDLLDLSSAALAVQFWTRLIEPRKAFDLVSRDDLLEALERVASDALARTDRTWTYPELKAIVGADALRACLALGVITAERDPTDPLRSRRLRLRHEFAWEHRMAQLLVERAQSLDDLEPLLAQPLTRKSESLLQRVLIAADDAGHAEIWERAEASPHVPMAVVWLASAQANRQTQEQRVARAAQPPSAAPLERRETFGLLRFLESANRKGVDSAQILAASARHYPSFTAHGFGDLFGFTAHRALARVTKPGELTSCLTALVGSESVTDARHLANAALAAAQRVSADREEVLEVSLNFLSAASASPNFTAVRTDQAGASQAQPFYDAYIERFSNVVVAEHGLQAYTWLSTNHWFISVHGQWSGGAAHQLENPVAIQMRKRTALALGDWYRGPASRADRKRYVDLVDEEASVTVKGGLQAAIALANATYLIKHSATRSGSGERSIDRRFLPALRALNANPQTPALVRPEIESMLKVFNRAR